MDLERIEIINLISRIEKDLKYTDKRGLIQYLIKVLKKDVEHYQIFNTTPKILFQYDMVDLNEKELNYVKTYIDNCMSRYKK